MGADQSLKASVAVNWMVKDGVGRIARFLIASKFSRKFDANVKVSGDVTSKEKSRRILACRKRDFSRIWSSQSVWGQST